MKIISDEQIRSLGISPAECVDWVKESFRMKYECQCPAKMSVHPTGNDFITTMPALLPSAFDTFGVKVVSRKNGRHPSLKSQMSLFDVNTGSLVGIMDADWITTMRTGAVATLAMDLLRKPHATHVSIIGLGNTATSTLRCMSEYFANESFDVKLMAYKDQAERFIENNKHCHNIKFHIVHDKKEFLRGAEIVVSCITDASGLLFGDVILFEPGVLVLPIHTRGFQNCDTVFDKVYGDDTDHIKGFRYFSQFKQFDELSNVLLGENPGRTSDTERIIDYNIGLGLHDVWFGYKILKLIERTQLRQV